MISLNDVLLARANIPVDDPIAEIWGRGLQGGDKIIEYTDTLPITITANGDVLLDYRIYGADGGVGVATENLWNFSASTKGLLQPNGSIDTNQNYSTSDYIPVASGQSYTFRALSGYASGRYVRAAWYDSDRQFVDYLTDIKIVNIEMIYTKSYTAPSNASYARVSGYSYLDTEFMFTEGSTAPESYIPYGYKLPMTIGDGNTAQTVPVYIGDNQLAEGEYVSYGEQKIYRRTENLFDINNLFSTVVVQGQTFTKPRSAYFFDVFSGTDGASAPMNLQKSIPVTSGTYTLSFEESETNISVVFSDGETQTVIIGSSRVTPRTFDVSSDGYISIRCENPAVCSVKKLQIVKASTAPEQYIPYVAPTDPPVPLPEIPTIDGTTVIDYDGDPKPSQMYIKYKSKG